MKLHRRQFLHLATSAAALPGLPRIARAQAYPTRPVRKRIFLVHPTMLGMPPIDKAFKLRWPQAQTLNLVDESLFADLPPDGALAPAIYDRLANLFRHCEASGADGIVFTGSTFGPAVEAVRALVHPPVLKADEAMMDLAVERGARILLVVTAERSLPVVRASLDQSAASAGRTPQVTELWVAGARDAILRGEVEAHDRMIAEQVAAAGDFDVIVLGQISMVSAVARFSPELAARVLTSPDAAVMRMRALLGE
jgi:Asp/Glu/hydantoin racemase